MAYEVYALHPSAELIDVYEELDDAVGRCEELVHEEAYLGAEVWDEDGEFVHAVGRTGATRLPRGRLRGGRGPASPLVATDRVPPHEGDEYEGGADEDDADAARGDRESTTDVAMTGPERRPAVARVEPFEDSHPPHEAPPGAADATAERAVPASTPPQAPLLGEAGSVQWFGV